MSVFRQSLLKELGLSKRRKETRIPDVGVEYLECKTNQCYHLHSSMDPSSPPFACDFSPVDNDYLLIAQEDGLVHLYDTSAEDLKALIHDYEAHDNAVFDVKWLPSGKCFLTASGDQTIRLIDAERGAVVNQFFGHTMSVRSLSLIPSNGKIFASASRDGSLRIWDIRLKPDVNPRGTLGLSSVGFIPQCHVPEWPAVGDTETSTTQRSRTPSRRPTTDAKSVTSVVFMNDSTLLSAGSTDAAIKMWDLRRLFTAGKQKTAQPKLVFPYRGTSQKRSGYSDLRLDSTKTRLYANCLDNVIYEYDLIKNSTRPSFVYTGHRTDSFYIKLDISPDDGFLICGSSDRRAYIYAVGQRQQLPVYLSGHTGEVSVPRWCPGDPTRVVTLSDDSRAFVWNMFPARSHILPRPGQLAGMAQRLTPLQTEMMNPSVQQNRILRSPHFTVSRLNPGDSHPLAVGASTARRRQSNIRSFLAVTLPSSMKKAPIPMATGGGGGGSSNSSISNTGTVLHSNRSVRPSTALTEAALAGVVQRFPALTVAAAAAAPCPPSPLRRTPPLGCYAAPPAPDRQTLLSGVGRLAILDEPNADKENLAPLECCPQSPISRFELPLDGIDETSLTKSPVLRCSLSSFPRTSESSPQPRRPLGETQSSLGDSQLTTDTGKTWRGRTRPAAAVDNLEDVRSATSPEMAMQGRTKRRRLTVYATSSTDTQTPRSPSVLPKPHRRRMTTVFPSPSHSITRYFKRDGGEE